MQAIEAVLGFIMLILGRQAYPLFVGGMFYVATLYMGRGFFSIESETTLLGISVAIGLTAGLLSFVLKRYMAFLAAFLAGGYLILNLPLVFGNDAAWVKFIYAPIAGVVAMLLVGLWFDYGMILLTALTGSTIVAQSIHFSSACPVAIFILLLVFGLIVQAILMQYGQPAPDSRYFLNQRKKSYLLTIEA